MPLCSENKKPIIVIVSIAVSLIILGLMLSAIIAKNETVISAETKEELIARECKVIGTAKDQATGIHMRQIFSCPDESLHIR